MATDWFEELAREIQQVMALDGEKATVAEIGCWMAGLDEDELVANSAETLADWYQMEN